MTRRRLRVLLLPIGLATFAAWGIQDPTRPTDPALYFADSHPSNTSAWTLQSIESVADQRIAIINGSRVREGDRLDHARIVSIKPSCVVVDTGESTLTLRLPPEALKEVMP